jgi:hypothetical protein
MCLIILTGKSFNKKFKEAVMMNKKTWGYIHTVFCDVSAKHLREMGERGGDLGEGSICTQSLQRTVFRCDPFAPAACIFWSGP